jgi:hypothetical protein
MFPDTYCYGHFYLFWRQELVPKVFRNIQLCPLLVCVYTQAHIHHTYTNTSLQEEISGSEDLKPRTGLQSLLSKELLETAWAWITSP